MGSCVWVRRYIARGDIAQVYCVGICADALRGMSLVGCAARDVARGMRCSRIVARGYCADAVCGGIARVHWCIAQRCLFNSALFRAL